MPATRSQRLDYRSIFIFPSKAGIWFLVLLFILLIAAINYQNSMLYGFTFLLGAVFAVSILHCYRNFSGLRIELVASEGSFPGDGARFGFRLSQTNDRRSEALQLKWPGQGESCWVASVDGEGVDASVMHKAVKRGYLRPGRLLVETIYPIGLVRAWTWLDFGAEAVVFPKPIDLALQTQVGSDVEEHGERKSVRGNEEYQGLRQYSPGDSLKHVAWKQFAQRDELFTKDFVSWQGDSPWLDLASLGPLDLEMKLSFLCYEVIRLTEQQQLFGLRLGSMEIAPALGIQHKIRCLTALGEYGHSKGNPNSVSNSGSRL